MQVSHFKTYLNNLNRVHLVTLIDDMLAESRQLDFRASLVANPVTGAAYECQAPEGQPGN